MSKYVKNLSEKLFKKKSVINLYESIKKRQRRSFGRDNITKFGDPISKYSKYH